MKFQSNDLNEILKGRYFNLQGGFEMYYFDQERGGFAWRHNFNAGLVALEKVLDALANNKISLCSDYHGKPMMSRESGRKDICANCKWWNDSTEDHWQDCRGNGMDMSQPSHWPTSHREHWCSSHTPR